MGRRGPLRLGLALAVVLVAQHTLGAEVCRSGCKGATNKVFKYTPGTTYKYNYEGKIDITLSSAEGQSTSTEVKAVVLLTQLPDCNQVLRLQHVQIVGANGKKMGSIPDVEKPIRINFHDGHIEDSICAEPGDSQNSLNIKRAIASMFQVNLKGTHETDVFGVCGTETAQHNEGNVLVVQKSRNLNKCSYRESIRQDFLTTAFNLHSEIKSSPVLDGEYSAKLRIKNGILEQANVVENYLYVPFSVGKHGAKAQVSGKLHLAGTSKENPQVHCSQPKSIIFENPHQVIAPTNNVNTILNAVKEVVKTIDIVVGEKTAKEFVNLIKTVRASKKDDLLGVYNQVKSGVGFGDKVAAKRIFLDALLEASTGDTVEVAVTLLKNNELNDVEKNLVYIGMSYVRHATEASLNTAATLLAQRDLPFKAYLGIGNLAGRYCRQHSCEKVDAVNKLIQKLIAKLGDAKAANKQEENEMVYALKALANIGYLSDTGLQKIISIAQDKQAPNRLRVVALETYMADACKDKLRNSALHILQDIQQDSEVRIKAYLVLAQCPNAKIGNAVKALLEKEPSYQVGGFIVSHIRNIKASANPDKDLAKHHLGFSLPKKFPIDPRKYSYNGEFSYAINTLGLAASSEANVIYSQDSYIPRSSSLNLTAEIFGHSINFLEIQTRQENLDKLVEHYFGPKGILKTSSIGELLKNEKYAKDILDRIASKFHQTIRSRRDVSRAEIDKIGNAVKIKDNVLNKDLDVDLSVKAFGSEVFFSNLNVYQTGLTPEAVIDNIFEAFGKGLDRLKNFKETLRTNLVFLDLEFDYPTSLGFPLRLAVEGTANVQVQAEGNIDVRQLLGADPQHLRIKLVPSANVEVAGRLTLDALVVENGLKVTSNLYTATGGDLTVGFKNGESKDLDIKFSLPVKEQKLVTATHEIVFHTREQSGHESNANLKFAQGKDFSICLDQLSPIIGLVFCGEINGPNLAGKQIPVLPFPFAGDAMVSVNIEKEDVSEYRLSSKLTRDLGSWKFLVETIDNQGKPKAHFEVDAQTRPEQFIKAVFTSPIKSAQAEARITNNDQEKSLLLKFGMDQMEFLGKLGVSITGSAGKLTYKPMLVYKTPSGDQKLPVQVDGDITVEEHGNDIKYIFNNLKITVPTVAPIILKGYVAREDSDLSGDVSVSDGQRTGSLRGKLHAEPSLIKFNIEMKNNVNPTVNFDLKAELKRQPGQYDGSYQLIHGEDLSSKKHMLKLSHSLTSKYKSPKDFTFGFKSHASYPLVGFEGKLEYEETPKSLDYDVEFQYNDIKFGSELEMEINKKENGDFDLEFEIYGLDNKVEFKASREIQGEESKINNELVVNGEKMEVKGKIKHHLQTNNINVGADLVVKLPRKEHPFKVNSGLKYNPSELDAHHKITSGNVIIIDASLKANKQGTANGHIKVNIKNMLVINGQLKSNKGNGNANLLVDAQNIKKQVKLESTFHVTVGSLYNIDVTLYPSFGQDKNQKIIVSTHNQLSQNSIDSKNILNLLNKKMSFNVNGQKTGDASNGKLSGEIELTLPDEQYVLGKLNTERKTVKDLMNGHGVASIEYRKNKNAAGRKASIEATYKNTDPKQGLYDVTYNLAADDSNGKNINADIIIKRSKQGDQDVLQVENKIHGSVLKHPLTVAFVSKCNDGTVGHLEGSATFGTASFKITEKHDVRGNGSPMSGQLGIQLASNTETLKNLKAEISGSITKPKNPSDSLQVEGSTSLFAQGRAPEPIVDFKGEGRLRAGQNDGEFKGSIHSGKEGPISAAAGYSLVETGKQKQFNGNLGLQYGQGKNVKIDATLVRPDELQYKFDADIQTPVENFKKTTLSVHSKRSADNSHITNNIVATTDGKTYHVDTELKSSDISPLFNFKVKNPEGQVSQLYLKANRVGDKELSGEIKAICDSSDFLLEGNMDASIENIEEFVIKGNVNCPKLNLNKISFEAVNKPGKPGRKIQVNVKSAGKNLVSGSTNYQAREEHGKYIVEGSGNFKVKEESKSANFKYICQRLSKDKDGETGLEISFDGSLGNKAIDAEFKTTDKQVRNMITYCEKTKECAKMELDSKINRNDVTNFDHLLEITVDLRKLGLTHEFGLKSVTKRNNYVIDHTVDAHLQSQENSKYRYSVYLHPREAGVSFTTPKRIVALESKVVLPDNIKQGGKISGEVSFYLDKKNAPTKKAAVFGFVNVDTEAKLVDGELKATHPGLSRPLSASFKTVRSGTPVKGEVKVTVIMDIFAQPDQKVVATYTSSSDINAQVYSASFTESLSVKSSGLGVNIDSISKSNYDRQSNSGEYSSKLTYHVGSVNHESVFHIKGSRNSLELLIKALNLELLKVSSKADIGKDEQTVSSEISSLNKDVLLTNLNIKNYNTLSYSVGFRNTPKEKILLTAALIPGQIADIRADHSMPSGKNNLFYASLKLDDANFFKPDYNVNSKEIESVVLKAKDKVSGFLKDISDASNGISNDIRKEFSHVGDITKKAAIDIKPIQQYYQSELQKIKEEIVSDKSVKEFVEAFKKVFGALIQSASETVAKISEIIESSVQALQKTFAGVVESLNKELIPQLKDVLEKITEALAEMVKTGIDIAVAYLTTISQVIEKYQPDIKQFAATIGEMGQDIARFIQKSYVQVRKIVTEFWRNIYEEIKASPYYEQLKQQYNEIINNIIPDKEGLIGGIQEISATIKDAIPAEFLFSNELYEIIDLTVNYLEKKIKQQPTDDVAYLDQLLAINIKLLKKLATLLSTPAGYDIPKSDVPVSLDFLKKLPKIVAIKFSPIAHLLKDDPTEEIVGLTLALINHPRKWFAPFPIEGMIVQGQHIFTYDGKHLTFPGNCKYLLARDAVNGNFTIVGTYVDGALNAITLADQHDTLTLKKGGQVLLNGAATELPARKPEIAAYRDYQMITLVSTAGAQVICLPDLSGCGVTISGFYHGQLKGLLGNGNNEPYDDFTIPNGKIVVNEADFGNSYKMGSCQPVTVPKHDHHQDHPDCSKLFGWDSPMKYCFPFVPTENFKMACVHGKIANVQGTELAIAKAYVAACQSHNIPISVPSNLLECTNSDKPYQVGDKFSVKLPGKAADIVLLVDTLKVNEPVYKDLVQPTVQEIVKTLAAKGIKDVQFHLVTYGGDNQWPSHVTVNGKLTFNEKAPNVKFGDAPKKDELPEGIATRIKPYLETLESVLHDLSLAFGLDLQARTYNEGVEYPFRAHALKSVIAVTSRPCEVGRLLVLQKLRTLLYRNNQISLNLITPFQGFALKDTKKTKDVIGFNEDHVFTLSQAQKKPEGSAELYKDLQYSDFCVDFTVKNRGNVFVTDNFVDNKEESARKHFIHATAHNIVQELVNIEQGLDCECQVVDSYSAQNVCEEAYSKDKSRKA